MQADLTRAAAKKSRVRTSMLTAKSSRTVARTDLRGTTALARPHLVSPAAAAHPHLRDRSVRPWPDRDIDPLPEVCFPPRWRPRLEGSRIGAQERLELLVRDVHPALTLGEGVRHGDERTSHDVERRSSTDRCSRPVRGSQSPPLGVVAPLRAETSNGDNYSVVESEFSKARSFTVSRTWGRTHR